MKFKWVILFLLMPLLCQSQNNRIDSLTKALASLTDSGSVDCLNKLSAEYYINALAETYYNVHTDAAVSYAKLAYNQAVKIRYNKGIAEALQNLGEIARDRGYFADAENYFHQSIPLFKKIQALEKYSWANITLGWCLHMQCKFSEAKLSYERAMPYYIYTDNKERQSMLLRLTSYTYSIRGYNEKAFEHMLQAIKLTFKIKDVRGVVSSPENMGILYKDAGEPEKALVYFRLAAQNARTIKQPVRYYRLMGDICVLTSQPDSAIYYYRESHKFVEQVTSDTIIRKRDLANESVSIGEVYLKQQKYHQAIEQLKQSLQFFEKGNNRNVIMRVLRGLARCYQMQQNIPLSFLYAKQLFATAQETGSRPFLRDAYELYWNLYDRQGKTDSAYKYNLKFIAIKDSILRDEYLRNIALSEMKC